MQSKDFKISVIGAGIGGLVVTLALQRLGYKVSIYERAEELSEIGAGLTIPPNARRCFNFLGLDEELNKISHRPIKAAYKDYFTGKVLSEVLINNPEDYSFSSRAMKSMEGTLQVHRADLHSLLVNTIFKNDSDCINLGFEAETILSSAGRTTINFSNDCHVVSEALIACDGNNSAIRKCLYGGDTINYLGYVAWRGLVSASKLPKSLIEPDTASYFGKDKIFARYKVRGGSLINYVAFSKKSDWHGEDWTIRSSLDEVMKEFRDASQEIQTLIEKTPSDQCYKWALAGRKPLNKWTHENITLLGDAAHPMLPFLGQGAAMAIEDGVILARCFESSSTINEIFSRYEKARLYRTSMVTLGAEYNGLKLSGDPRIKDIDESLLYTEETVANYDPVTVPI